MERKAEPLNPWSAQYLFQLLERPEMGSVPRACFRMKDQTHNFITSLSAWTVEGKSTFPCKPSDIIISGEYITHLEQIVQVHCCNNYVGHHSAYPNTTPAPVDRKKKSCWSICWRVYWCLGGLFSLQAEFCCPHQCNIIRHFEFVVLSSLSTVYHVAVPDIPRFSTRQNSDLWNKSCSSLSSGLSTMLRCLEPDRPGNSRWRWLFAQSHLATLLCPLRPPVVVGVSCKSPSSPPFPWCPLPKAAIHVINRWISHRIFLRIYLDLICHKPLE